MRLVYIGNMSKSYDLMTVVLAVREMDGVFLDLAGTGPDEAKLRAAAKSCERIRFHGYVGADEVRALLSSADAGIVPMFPDSMVAVPGKFCEYAKAGKPIVNSLTGESADLLKEYGAGVQYEAGNAASFREAVGNLWKLCGRDGVLALYEAKFCAAKVYPNYARFCYNIAPL